MKKALKALFLFANNKVNLAYFTSSAKETQ